MRRKKPVPRWPRRTVEEESYRQQEEVLAEEIDLLKTGLQAQEETGKNLEGSLDEAREFLTRIYAEFSALKEKGDHLAREEVRLQEALTERQGRRRKLADRLAAGDLRKKNLEVRMAEGRQTLTLAGAELEKLGRPDPGRQPGLGE